MALSTASAPCSTASIGARFRDRCGRAGGPDLGDGAAGLARGRRGRLASRDRDAQAWSARRLGARLDQKELELIAGFTQGDGSLFGGYVAALADQALAFAAMTMLPGDAVFRTVNLNLNFIRVGKAGRLDIEARVGAQTRRIITTRAEIRREDGELIAEASAQQIVQPVGSGG